VTVRWSARPTACPPPAWPRPSTRSPPGWPETRSPTGSPSPLAGVVPVADGPRRLIVEAGGGALPLSPEGPVLPLLALSGGHPVDLFAEWDGFTLTPLSALTDGILVAL